MGWDFCDAWKSKADVLKAETYDGRFGPGSHAMAVQKVRKGAWVLWEHTTKPSTRFIEFLLIERQDGCYGVKSMTAEMHPYYYDCPALWLDIAGVTFDPDWAKGVRAGAAAAKTFEGIPRAPRG